MTTELKPCPFCGCAVTISSGGSDLRWLLCSEGSACAGSGLHTVFKEADQAAAIAAWNRRTPAPQDGYSAGVRAALHGILEDSNLARHLDGRLCCDGHECGCQGASVRSYLEWLAKEAPALPDARAGAAEPVAWLYERKGFKPSVSMRKPEYSDLASVQPLYAAPPTPACTATDGPASACVYRAPGLGTAADWERG